MRLSTFWYVLPDAVARPQRSSLSTSALLPPHCSADPSVYPPTDTGRGTDFLCINPFIIAMRHYIYIYIKLKKKQQESLNLIRYLVCGSWYLRRISFVLDFSLKPPSAISLYEFNELIKQTRCWMMLTNTVHIVFMIDFFRANNRYNKKVLYNCYSSESYTVCVLYFI